MNIHSYIGLMLQNTALLDSKEIEKIERVAYILKTIAHPIRLGVVRLLTEFERLPVNEICEKLGTEQSLTSHHLQNLKLKGLLSVQREGRNKYYSLQAKEVAIVIDCLEHCNINM